MPALGYKALPGTHGMPLRSKPLRRHVHVVHRTANTDPLLREAVNALRIVCGIAVGAAAGFAGYAAMNAGKNTWSWKEAAFDTATGVGAGRTAVFWTRFRSAVQPGKHGEQVRHSKFGPQLWQRNLKGQTHKHRLGWRKIIPKRWR